MSSDESVAYLRLSDMRVEESLEGREAKLRALSDDAGWNLVEIIIENDIVTTADGVRKPKPATAWKRRPVTLPSGHVALRVIRPKFRDVLLPALMNGKNLVTEYADRICRDHRDGVDFLEAVEIGGVSVRSLNNQFSLTDGGTTRERDDFRREIDFAEREGRAKSERASNGRERWAGKSYQGGRRPFGFRVAPDTEMYHRNLVIDEAEAAVIRECADAVLFHDTSLRSLARDLRHRGIRTVTGQPFSAERLREALIKPAIAGLQPYKDEQRDAPWPPILDRAVWESLCCTLTDESRRTNGSRANEPRWLLSCYATCGACGAYVIVTGTERNRYYVCSADGCTRCRAVDADEAVAKVVKGRMSEPDARKVLSPPPRPGVDVAALKAESRRLAGKRAEAREMFASDEMSRGDLAAVLRSVNARQALIDAQLAASASAPDIFAEFWASPAAVAWAALPLARQRQVVRRLVRVEVTLTPRRTPFGPDSLHITRLT